MEPPPETIIVSIFFFSKFLTSLKMLNLSFYLDQFLQIQSFFEEAFDFILNNIVGLIFSGNKKIIIIYLV